jgi:hypothetical protein
MQTDFRLVIHVLHQADLVVAFLFFSLVFQICYMYIILGAYRFELQSVYGANLNFRKIV